MGKVGLITYPDSGPIGRLKDLFAGLAGSVNQALPVKFVATLAALNAISLNTDSLPAGTLAMLAADDSGLAAGAQFSMNPDGKWRLIGTCTALNIDTFVTSLTTLLNIKTQAGATCWNSTTTSMCVFTATDGTYVNITTSIKVSGGGDLTSVGVNGVKSIAVAFPTGIFSAPPSFIGMTSHSGMLTCYPNGVSATGFTANFRNTGNGNSSSVDSYQWMAFA